MSLEIVPLAVTELGAVRARLLDVYRAAFELPPYNERQEDVDRFDEALTRHSLRKGFRCCVARDSSDGRLLGFAYGYRGGPGDYWWEAVTAALPARMADKWLGNCFELTEIGVLPTAQGQGIGSWLHDVLLEGLDTRTAVLSTLQAETRARRLYRNRGWVTLLHDFVFPEAEDPYVVMGLDLQHRHIG